MIATDWIQVFSLNNNPMRNSFYLLFILFSIIGCSTKSKQPRTEGEAVNGSKESDSDGSIVCFVYHRFGDANYPSTNVSLSDFEAHLKYLKEENYEVVTFQKAMELLKSGNLPDRRAAVITIDDGYESFYKNGLPMLEKYDYPATLFINTETVGGNSYMSWDQLADSKEKGIEIGNHTHSHSYFLNIPKDKRYQTFKMELEKSQNIIQENLGSAPYTFAYPYGELDEEMKNIVREQGFLGAAAQNSGVIYSGTDRWKCPRFPISEFYSSPDKFASKANMLPFQIVSEDPQSCILPKGESTPVLNLKVKSLNLQLSNANVFVQGGKGILNVDGQGDETTNITIKASSPVDSRRRTLYTLTAQDENGKWHWFSHLWINPEVK